jgi:hypothetical protein
MLFGLRQELSAPYLPTNGAIAATANPGTNTGKHERDQAAAWSDHFHLHRGPGVRKGCCPARNRPENSEFGQDIERNKPRFSVRVIDSLWIEGLLEKNS